MQGIFSHSLTDQATQYFSESHGVALTRDETIVVLLALSELFLSFSSDPAAGFAAAGRAEKQKSA